MKKRYFIIPVDVFDADVTVAVNMTEREIVTKYRKDKNSGIAEAIKGWDAEDNPGSVAEMSGQPLILLRQKPGDLDYATIVHEIAHAAFGFLRDKGIHPNHTTEEVFCYLQGFLAKEIVKRMKG